MTLDRSGRPFVIAPSILAAEFGAMAAAVQAAEAAGADVLHLDVMDGHFVPEITFGRQMIQAVHRSTRLPLDVHLMVANPARHIVPFVEAGGGAVTVHVEAATSAGALRDLLQEIRGAGAASGAALKPDTGAEALEPVWDLLDQVLVMTVEPGYGGQPFREDQLAKIEAVARARKERGLDEAITIAVDGGIDERTAPLCARAGASFLVAGSSVFSTRRSVAEGVSTLRASLKPLGRA